MAGGGGAGVVPTLLPSRTSSLSLLVLAGFLPCFLDGGLSNLDLSVGRKGGCSFFSANVCIIMSKYAMLPQKQVLLS